jgi:O-antigen ligase
VAFMVAWWRGAASAPQWRWNSPLPWTALLFMLHLLGMLWSTNWDYGLFDLQIKLPLLLLPLIGLARPRDTSSLSALAVLAMVSGSIAAVVLGVVNVVVTVHPADAPPLGQVIFGPTFSFLMHSSYFALILLFGMAGMLLTRLYMDLPRWMLLCILPILCVGIVLCGSKIGWLLFPVVLLWILFARWYVRSIRWSIMVLGMVTFLGLGTLIAVSPFAYDRVREVASAVLEPGAHADAATSTEVRKLAWSSAIEVAGEHSPLGTGTGDVKDELIATYLEKDYTYLAELRINAHSQFLQMYAALGWPGLMLAIAMLLVPLIFLRSRAGPLLPLFLVLCLFNWAVESMLEVQAGVLFFAFFALLLSPLNERTSPRDPIQPPTH